jgi:hypothetical protein
MNQTQINARAVNTSFSNPFSTNLNQTRSPGGSASPKNNWADLQSEIQIMRPDPKGDKMRIEIDKCSVFQNQYQSYKKNKKDMIKQQKLIKLQDQSQLDQREFAYIQQIKAAEQEKRKVEYQSIVDSYVKNMYGSENHMISSRMHKRYDSTVMSYLCNNKDN